jgi:hypothetical protein
MKIYYSFFICLIAFNMCAGQNTLSTSAQIYVSTGFTLHTYSQYHWGWYAKTGFQKRVFKNLNIRLQYMHTSANSFPKRFYLYSFQSSAEQELLERWKGITDSEWVSQKKGFFRKINGDILAFILCYDIQLSKKMLIIPKIGLSHISASDFTTGVFDAQFINGKLTDGKIGYDMRNSGLLGWCFGFTMSYRVGKNWSVFIDLENNKDIDGGNGFNYYEAKQLGAGIAFHILSR